MEIESDRTPHFYITIDAKCGTTIGQKEGTVLSIASEDMTTEQLEQVAQMETELENVMVDYRNRLLSLFAKKPNLYFKYNELTA